MRIMNIIQLTNMTLIMRITPSKNHLFLISPPLFNVAVANLLTFATNVYWLVAGLLSFIIQTPLQSVMDGIILIKILYMAIPLFLE